MTGVHFTLRRGEVVALLGENGAGKSTLMKILGGVYEMDQGDIALRGRSVRIVSPRHAQELGIATVHQELNLCPNQDISTAIFTGREPRRQGVLGAFGLVDRRKMRHQAKQYLRDAGVFLPDDTLVHSLSVAERQKVEIAKALSLNAEIMILDEPTSSLGVAEAENLFRLIAQLKNRGIGIVFVSHRLDEVFRISDRIVVLRDGHLVDELVRGRATVEQVIRMMVGRPVGAVPQRSAGKSTAKQPILHVNRVQSVGSVREATFTLYPGEILGMAGLVGSGRSGVARLLFGIDRLRAGEMTLTGVSFSPQSPRDAIRRGVALVPEDRQQEGLMLGMPVWENIGLPSLDFMSRFGWVQRSKVRAMARDVVQRLAIRTPDINRKVMYLSGGNQQKVVLGKWMNRKVNVLILDEPTRGVDVGAKEEVHGWIRHLADQGIGILLISSELPELMALSHRIVVMWEGRLVAEMPREGATQEEIMTYASGQKIMRSVR